MIHNDVIRPTEGARLERATNANEENLIAFSFCASGLYWIIKDLMKVFDCIVTTGEIHTLRIFELHSVLLQAIMGGKGNGGIG